MGAKDIERLLWAAIALGIIYTIRKLQVAGERILEVGQDAYEGAVNRTANAIETFFPLTHPNAMITYTVTFPDGIRHAVLGESVDRNGYFTYGSVRYRLLTNSAGTKIAVLV